MRNQATGKSLLAPAYTLAALALWALSVLSHDWGTVLVRTYFTWVSQPGVLHEAGGTMGFKRGEYVMAAALGLPVLGLAAAALWRLRRRGTAALKQRLARLGPAVLGWAVLSYIAWKAFIVFASELAHFGQYALIGGLLALALRGRQPQAAFLATVGLGLVDEAWQHYVLHRWWLEEPQHWLDWSDFVLNALGACGGILLLSVGGWAETRCRDRTPLVWLATAAAAALLLPLLLLDQVTLSRLMGHYPAYPLWNEFANHKPVYWPQPRQGIPLFLGSVLLLGTLVRPGRPRLEIGGLAAVCLLGALALDPPSRREGQPLHAAVPSVRVPYAAKAPVADGVLDEPAWAAAPRLGPLVGSLDGKDHITYTFNGVEHRQALQETYARLLWDEEALYIAVEVSDTDIWVRDDELEFLDEHFSVCIDDGGDEITYYVFSVDAANQVYDYFTFIPAAPMDFNPWNRHIGLPHWEARGLRTAVAVDGTLERVKSWNERPAVDRDRGYTIEMAIPWENFRTTSVPHDNAMRQSLRPLAGEHWRLGLFRTEYPRLAAADMRPGEFVDAAVGRALLGDETWERAVNDGRLKPRSADGLFELDRIHWQSMARRVANQAWRPTYNTWMHFPAYFGVMELAPRGDR